MGVQAKMLTLTVVRERDQAIITKVSVQQTGRI